MWRKVLGRGGTSTIQACLHRAVGKVFAVKSISKHELYMQKLGPSVRREVIVHSYLNGLDGFASKLFNVTEDESSLMLVMGLACGGTLRDMSVRAGGKVTESAARFYIAEAAVALGLLHDEQYLHGDIKPRNICIDAGGHVVLVDFGSSRRVLRRDSGKFATISPDGTEWMTTDYAAPELIERRPYGPAVDWFSLGAVMFELLTGSPPFSEGAGSLRRDTEANIRNGSRRRLPGGVSEDCADVLNRLLRQDPDRRLDAEGLLAHPWMAGVDVHRVRSRSYRPPFVPELRFRGDTRYFPVPTSSPRRHRDSRSQAIATGYAAAANFPLCSQVRPPTLPAAVLRLTRSSPAMAGRAHKHATSSGRSRARHSKSGVVPRRSSAHASDLASPSSIGLAADATPSVAIESAVAEAVSGSMRFSRTGASPSSPMHAVESSSLVVTRPFGVEGESYSEAGGSHRFTTVSGASGLSHPYRAGGSDHASDSGSCYREQSQSNE